MTDQEKKFRLDLDEDLEAKWPNNPEVKAAARYGASWAFQWFAKQSQWISVKTSLPEEGEQCIAYLEFRTEEPETICAGFDENGFYNLEDRNHYFKNVKRWQPIPKP